MTGPNRSRLDWKTLITLSIKYNKAGQPLPGPAVQTTYSCLEDTYFFSHTPGVITRDGLFRPVQHLHNRHAEVYALLLCDAVAAVSAAKKLGMERVECAIVPFQTVARDAQMAGKTLAQVEMAVDVVSRKYRSQEHKMPRKTKVERPGFRASIGDVIKAKGTT